MGKYDNRFKSAVGVRITRPQGGSDKEEYVEIAITDNASGIAFCEIKMTLPMLVYALTASSGEGIAEFAGLDHIGKKHEIKHVSKTIETADYNRMVHEATEGNFDRYADRHKIVSQYLIDHGGEDGWLVSAYLGSQSSVKSSYQNKTTTLNYSLYRFVEISEEERTKLRGY